jgi:hypothetical protein
MINKNDIPNITKEYFELVMKMFDNPGLYGLDSMRSELHIDLCDCYGLSRDETADVTGNLDKIKDAYELHLKLEELVVKPGRKVVCRQFKRGRCSHNECLHSVPHEASECFDIQIEIISREHRQSLHGNPILCTANDIWKRCVENKNIKKTKGEKG